jgi:hypothetical protein
VSMLMLMETMGYGLFGVSFPSADLFYMIRTISLYRLL